MEETAKTYKFSDMILCQNCNSYGFPSIYTLVSKSSRVELCTGCANRIRFDNRYIVNEQTMEISLHAAASTSISLEKHSYGSDEIYMKVMRAEIEKEKKEWYLRACKVGICPKCGCEVKEYSPFTYDDDVLYNQEYKCTNCSFDTWEKEENE